MTLLVKFAKVYKSNQEIWADYEIVFPVQYLPQTEKILLLHDKIKQQNGKTGHISHPDTYVDYIDWNEGNVVCNRIGQKVLS